MYVGISSMAGDCGFVLCLQICQRFALSDIIRVLGFPAIMPRRRIAQRQAV